MERNMKKKKKKKQKKREEEEEGPEALEDEVLVFHILPRLPVKSLFRFKCVCKKWRRWISSDPIFMREQSQRSMASPGFIYLATRGLGLISTDGTPFHIPDPFLKFLKVYKPLVLASCNGLLCVQSYRKSIFVCNPVTEEWSLIPETKLTECFGLAFDPLDSFQAFKLVGLSCPRKPRVMEGKVEFGFNVFSSGTCLWTMSTKKVFVEENPYYYSLPKFVGGVLYWELNTQFIWFDLQRDLAGVLVKPPKSDRTKHFTCSAVGVWKDKLTYTRMVGDDTIDSWVLSEFKWIRVFEASLDSAILGVDSYCKFLQGWRNYWSLLPYQGEENLYFAVQKDEISFEVCCYKMKTREMSKLYGCQMGQFPLILFPYNNSFVRLPKLPVRVTRSLSIRNR